MISDEDTEAQQGQCLHYVREKPRNLTFESWLLFSLPYS